MNNFLNWYKENKLISITATVLIVALVAGGIGFGIYSANKPNAEESKQVTVKENKEKDKESSTEYICYNTAGKYSDKIKYTAGEIVTDGVTVENASFDNLTITEAVGDGSVTLNNVKVSKLLVINGGGQNSVNINGGSYKEIVSNDYDCHVVINKDAVVETLTALDSQLIEIDGKVTTTNILPTTYEGEVTWEHGIKTGESANIDNLKVAEEISDKVKIEGNFNAIKSQVNMNTEEAAGIRAQASNATTNASTTTSQAQVNTGGATNNSGSTTDRIFVPGNNTNGQTTPEPAKPNKPKKVVQTVHSWGNISKDHPVAQHQIAYDDYSYDSIETVDVNCTYTVRYEEEFIHGEWDEPVTSYAEGFVCSDCGYNSTDYNDMLNHCEVKNHHKGINESRWAVDWDTIHHPAKYQKREYITYTCSECGQTYEQRGGLVGEQYSK
jgi:hypothetical protein